MRDYGQIITKVQDTPWLMTEGGLRTMLGILNEHLAGNISIEEIRARTEGGRRERGSLPSQAGSVGILPLHGPMFPKANLMTELSGATSMEQWNQEFDALMANDRVESILLEIDSPGGSSFMVEETANKIRQARETKPVYAIANTMAASAAFWVASQASELYVTDSGFVGSVGTFIVHTDDSALQEKVGVKETIIREGRFKAALMEPLTPDAKGYIQDITKQVNDQFILGVAEGRKTTPENVVQNYGEGGVVTARKALETGMVDGIRTFDEVLGALLDGGGTAVSKEGNGGSSGFSLKMSFDREMEHSEPGTGTPPQPRVPPEDEDIDKWNKGERLERPPNIPELEESVMNHEELIALAQKLNISNAASLDEDTLKTRISAELDDTLSLVGELREATADAQQEVDFAKQFPEQAERLRKLEETSQRAEATEFANSLADFKLTEGDKETSFRLSVLAQDVVRDSHIKLAQGVFAHDDMKHLIHSVALGGVQQGEVGSSRQDDTLESIPQDRQTVRQLFSAKVSELMQSDNLSRKDAVKEAGKRYPDLAKAYAQS